jgi:hypothetical protein
MNNIQHLFFDNLKSVFNSYNSFYENMEKEYRAKIYELEKNKEKYDKDYNNILSNLEINRFNLIKSLETQLASFLKNLPENPLSLPIKTKIVIDNKNLVIENLTFSQCDSTTRLFEIVKAFFTNLGDEINFNDDSQFYIQRNNLIDAGNNEILIKKESKFIENNFTIGDLIILKGNFTLKSEAPKCCITYNFDVNKDNLTANYFSCETCKLNCKQILNYRVMFKLYTLLP